MCVLCPYRNPALSLAVRVSLEAKAGRAGGAERGQLGRAGGNTSRLPLISLECVEHTLHACVCICVCVRPGPRTGRAGLMQPLGDTNKSKHDKTIENFFHFHF